MISAYDLVILQNSMHVEKRREIHVFSDVNFKLFRQSPFIHYTIHHRLVPNFELLQPIFLLLQKLSDIELLKELYRLEIRFCVD